MSLEAMKMALETLERLDRWLALRYGNELTPPEREVVKALRQAIEQAEQGNNNLNYPITEINTSIEQEDKQERVDETAKREHEPWCDSVTKLLLSMPPQIPPCNCKPKREWAGLTDDEINHTSVRWTMIDGPGDFLLPFAKAIEAKLKEKNT
jgi:hypothetical protein